VTEIRNHLNPVEVITETGQTFTCGKVLLAIPEGTMYKIKYGILSETKRLLMNNMLDSWCIRMTMVFKEPFWRYTQHSGNVNFSH
jgi:monoamine oxidase